MANRNSGSIFSFFSALVMLLFGTIILSPDLLGLVAIIWSGATLTKTWACFDPNNTGPLLGLQHNCLETYQMLNSRYSSKSVEGAGIEHRRTSRASTALFVLYSQLSDQQLSPLGCKNSNHSVVRHIYELSEEWVRKRIGRKGTKRELWLQSLP